MLPVKWIYWSALSALGCSSNTTALSPGSLLASLMCENCFFFVERWSRNSTRKKKTKHIIMPLIYLIDKYFAVQFCLRVMQMCYSLSECWISRGKNLYVMFFVSPFDRSIGSMSSPARWASASFTQGSRSMDEVRELVNMVPHIRWCCREGCTVTKRESLTCVLA